MKAELGPDRYRIPLCHAEVFAMVRRDKEAEAARRREAAEKDRDLTDRRCPQCAAPCPTYRETCKACGYAIGRDGVAAMHDHETPLPPANHDGEDTKPFMTLRDIPALIMIIPFALLFGWHIAGIAMLLRKWTRIPYVAWMVVLYALLWAPLVLTRPPGIFICIPLCPAAIIQLWLIGVLRAGGRDEWLDGNNLEIVAPLHIATVLAYWILPVIYIVLARVA